MIKTPTVVNNSNDEKRAYFGASDTTFKDRYRTNTRDFINERYSKRTVLSNYIWQLKRDKKIPNIEWKIVRKMFSDTKSNHCLFRLKKKYFIYNCSHEEILCRINIEAKNIVTKLDIEDRVL